jgi:phage terminase large subunit-like protein
MSAESLAVRATDLSPDELAAYLDGLTPEEQEALLYDWSFWARPNQLPPDGEKWRTWLLLAGRGFGKTRAGAEWINKGARTGLYSRFHLIGPTASDTRDTMVEGPSGILEVAPPDFHPHYSPTKRRIEWPNGAVAMTFSADEPERLRGPQCMAAWADELCAWRYQEDAWMQLMLGLRLGPDPRCIITTTPKPQKVLKDIMKLQSTITVKGTTYENLDNLAPAFAEQIIVTYEGTRDGRQELLAEILDDAPGALWKRDLIEGTRVGKDDVPALERIVVSIDPSVTANKKSDDTGIIVAGLGIDGHGYLLDDLSGKFKVEEWARRSVVAYHARLADRIVAEKNQGGDMIESTLRVVDPNVSVRLVHASKAKITRAEPIAAAYERKMVHHVGSFPKLEDEMCFPAGTLVATDRGQVSIESIFPGDQVWTRQGLAPIRWAGSTGTKSLVRVVHSHGTIYSTPCHPIYEVTSQQFVNAQNVQPGDFLLVEPRWASGDPRSLGGANGGTALNLVTTNMLEDPSFIGLSGSLTMDLSRQVSTSTTLITTQGTIDPITSPWFPRQSTTKRTSRAAGTPSPLSSDRRKPRSSGRNDSRQGIVAWGVERTTYRPECVRPSAVLTVEDVIGSDKSVFDLTVADGYPHEFFANGVLVHNCEWEAGDPNSPNRLDAMVWAFTDLLIGHQARISAMMVPDTELLSPSYWRGI